MARPLARAIISICLGLGLFGAACAQNAPPPTPPAAPPTMMQARLEQIARRFPFLHYERLSDGPTDADDYMQEVYADQVTLNGAELYHEDVIAAKRRQSEQWPDQSYAVQPHSVTFQCTEATRSCDVSGIVDWQWSSLARGRVIAGSSRFLFTILLTARGVRIVSETEKPAPPDTASGNSASTAPDAAPASEAGR